MLNVKIFNRRLRVQRYQKCNRNLRFTLKRTLRVCNFGFEIAALAQVVQNQIGSAVGESVTEQQLLLN